MWDLGLIEATIVGGPPAFSTLWEGARVCSGYLPQIYLAMETWSPKNKYRLLLSLEHTWGNTGHGVVSPN